MLRLQYHDRHPGLEWQSADRTEKDLAVPSVTTPRDQAQAVAQPLGAAASGQRPPVRLVVRAACPTRAAALRDSLMAIFSAQAEGNAPDAPLLHDAPEILLDADMAQGDNKPLWLIWTDLAALLALRLDQGHDAGAVLREWCAHAQSILDDLAQAPQTRSFPETALLEDPSQVLLCLGVDQAPRPVLPPPPEASYRLLELALLQANPDAAALAERLRALSAILPSGPAQFAAQWRVYQTGIARKTELDAENSHLLDQLLDHQAALAEARQDLTDAQIREAALREDIERLLGQLHALRQSRAAQEKAQADLQSLQAQFDAAQAAASAAQTHLQAAVEERDARIEEQQALLAEREAELQRIHASKAWKLTAPLRWIRAQLRR